MEANSILLEIFHALWAILDVIFMFIDKCFRSIFNAIPSPAIPFLIGIFCFSCLAIFIIIIDQQDEGVSRAVLKRHV